MISNEDAEKIKKILSVSKSILVIQADNPDADSLGSSLALESILNNTGKQVYMYCGVEIPGYLRYLSGWDRVNSELPRTFDASIFVDVSTLTLLEKIRSDERASQVAKRPCIVLDHHSSVKNTIDFATAGICDSTYSSTGELIFHLAQTLNWHIAADAAAMIMTAILSDTQGLSNELATPESYRVMAQLIERGADRPTLEERRREYTRMAPEIFLYKATLISRTQFMVDGKLAVVDIPQEEINKYSPLYNPVPLIQNDILNVNDVAMAVVFKQYDDGKTTGAIRCNNGYPLANKLAEQLSGGGHPYASGFKAVGRPYNEIKSECIRLATELISSFDKELKGETIQYTDK